MSKVISLKLEVTGIDIRDVYDILSVLSEFIIKHPSLVYKSSLKTSVM